MLADAYFVRPGGLACCGPALYEGLMKATIQRSIRVRDQVEVFMLTWDDSKRTTEHESFIGAMEAK